MAEDIFAVSTFSCNAALRQLRHPVVKSGKNKGSYSVVEFIMQNDAGLPHSSVPAQWILPAFTLLFYLITINGYGYHRDEFYYMACG
jgi:hypothetical protein